MRTGVTASGLRYAVLQRSGAVGYCALTVGCGTRDEGDFPSGIAHLTEHTLFKGTRRKRAAEINNCLERLGGELNAYTTKEEIVLHATVLKEDLRKAVSLLLELATEATFPDAAVETERGVVIDEILSYKDVPADDVYDRFEEMLFAGHPLGRPVLGTVRSVKQITPERLRAFYASRFVPSRMALTLVADLDEARMEALALSLADAATGTMASSADALVRTPFSGEAAHFEKTLEKRNHEVNAVLGGLGPSLYSGPDRIATVLLCNLLGGPASNSLLGGLLRERYGWVYGVECNYTQYADCGMVAISFGCDRPNLDRCLGKIDTVLARQRETALTPRRLAAAKRQLLGQLLISANSGEAQVLSMGKSLSVFGRIDTEKQIREAVLAVTAEQLQTLSNRIFAPGKLSRLVFL